MCQGFETIIIQAICGEGSFFSVQSSRGSISCEKENPNILTYLRNRCNSLWSLGLIVASNKGTKMFSNIFPKLGRIFLDLNMSLKGKNRHIL